MSRKAILNLTSVKKRDEMRTYTDIENDDPNSPKLAPILSSALLNGLNAIQRDGYVFGWIATARNQIYGGATGDEADRESPRCYIRGLREHIRLQTSTPLPWLHRRIIFFYRGDYLWRNTTNVNGSPPNASSNRYYPGLTSSGQVRPLLSLPTGTSRGVLYDTMFRGTGKDFGDVFYAPLDSRKVSIYSDKLMLIKSDNDRGIIKSLRRWYPVNKNIVYVDGEDGTEERTGPVSVTTREGCGDMYIIDMFRPHDAAATTDQMRVDISATLYWHEK